jgi:hypothetical protein
MNQDQLDQLLLSTKSANSKFTLIGQALKRGELSWLESLYSDISIQEKVFLYINKLDSPKKCDICGNKTRFLGYSRGYRETCSVSCARKKSYLENGKEIYAKAVNTLTERYGVSSQFQLKSAIENRKLADEKRKGKKLSDEHKKLIKEGMIKRYGVENPSQAPEIREKINQTMNERYGGYYIASTDLRELKHDKWIERKLSLLESVYKTKLLEPYTSSKLKHQAKCIVCSTNFEINLSNGQVSKCPNCFFIPANKSLKEQELSEFVQSFGFTVLTNVKSKDLIYPLSLDIWIPELQMAIEFNGDYWHSDKFKDKSYHLTKLSACEAKNIQLIQVLEHEFDQKKDLVYSRISSILGKNQKIGARKCTIVKLSVKEEREFLIENHLQGYIPSSYKFGLKVGERLTMVMTLGRPRFNKTADLELLRVATLKGVTVVGGAKKLFNHVLKNLEFNEIISYRDRRWGKSSFYEQLGFELQHISSPSYFYVKKDMVIQRYAAQKKNLKKILGDNFDEALTESENMEKERFLKIWDCGQEVYSLHKI